MFKVNRRFSNVEVTTLDNRVLDKINNFRYMIG